MKTFGILAAALLVLLAAVASSHPMMGAITWNRHVSRIVYARCVSCHREGGSAFSLLEYAEAREAAAAIKAAVLERTMPPWGAVKGFGELREDGGLSATEIDLLVEWVDTNTPRGNNRRALPEEPPQAAPETPLAPPRAAIVVQGVTRLERPARIAGVLPTRVPADASLPIVAELPDGSVRPLVWLYGYEPDYTHAFWLAEPLALPSGTVIRGVPDEATVLLLPARRERRNRR